MKPESAPIKASTLIGDLSSLISATRCRVAQAVNSELVALYWQVGRRLHKELLNQQRAEYGKQVIKTVASALTAEFGRGFDKTNLSRMMKFAEFFPDQVIVDALRQQLSWTHLRELIVIDDPLKRQFYLQICCLERWSTRTLKAKINGMLFERTALAKRPTAVIEETLESLGSEGQMSPDLVFRDPYILDFLGMPSDYSESELEAAILREIETFLLELGSGFSFVARQKRLPVGMPSFESIGNPSSPLRSPTSLIALMEMPDSG